MAAFGEHVSEREASCRLLPGPWRSSLRPLVPHTGNTMPAKLVCIKQLTKPTRELSRRGSFVPRSGPAPEDVSAEGAKRRTSLQVDCPVEHHARRPDGDGQRLDHADRAAGYLP